MENLEIENVSGSAVHAVRQSVYPAMKSRVVPISLFRAINDCRVDMDSFLKSIGFGCLYGINIGDLHGRLNHLLVNSLVFDSDSVCIKLNRGSIKIDSKRVHDMFGIPEGGTPLLSLEETKIDLLTDWWAQFGDVRDPNLKKNVSTTHIAQQIVKATNIDFMFKMNFLVLITNTLAKNENTMGHLSLDVLKHFREDTPVQSIDWCGYILDCLMKSKIPKGAGCFYNGPMLFLTLLYLDSTKFESMSHVRSRPAIKDWNSTFMRNRLELEIEQGVFGDLELQEEWTREEPWSIEGSLNVEEPHNDLSRPSFELAPTDQEGFYEKIEAKISIISDHTKELDDTLKRFRELFPDDDKLADFRQRFAEMFLDNAEDSSSPDDDRDFGGDDGGAKCFGDLELQEEWLIREDGKEGNDEDSGCGDGGAEGEGNDEDSGCGDGGAEGSGEDGKDANEEVNGGAEGSGEDGKEGNDEVNAGEKDSGCELGGAEGSGEDGKDGDEEVNAGETRAGKVEDAEGSGGQGGVEGCGQKTRFGRKIMKPKVYSPGPKPNPKKKEATKSKKREATKSKKREATKKVKQQNESEGSVYI